MVMAQQEIELEEHSRTSNCEQCGAATTFERGSEAEPHEGEVCHCGMWLCVDCVDEHPHRN